MRLDLKYIADMVEEGSKVLELGCCEGYLLSYLSEHKKADTRGIEINQTNVSKCLYKGLSVIQGDIESDLQHYPDNCFDYTISSQVLQVVNSPKQLLLEILRISKYAIVSIPNFGYWVNRFYLMFYGKMPITETLSYKWYETPNIHFCTMSDFCDLCDEIGCHIVKKEMLSKEGKKLPFSSKVFPGGIFAEKVIFLLKKNNA